MDHTILGSILGPLIWGDCHMQPMGASEVWVSFRIHPAMDEGMVS